MNIHKYKITYKKNALGELEVIYLYIKNEIKEEKIANQIKNTILKQIENLQIFPFAYKLLKKSKNFEYRKFIIKNYIIIYKINLKEKEINILHIYNQKINWKKGHPLTNSNKIE